MSKLPRVSGAEALKALQRLGFEQVRQKGSHVIMRRGSKGCVVPLHAELKVGTLADCYAKPRCPRQSSSACCDGAAQLHDEPDRVPATKDVVEEQIKN